MRQQIPFIPLASEELHQCTDSLLPLNHWNYLALKVFQRQVQQKINFVNLIDEIKILLECWIFGDKNLSNPIEFIQELKELLKNTI